MAGNAVEQALKKLQEYARSADATDPDLEQLITCAFTELAELRTQAGRTSQVTDTILEIRTVPLQVLADVRAHDWAGLVQAA